LDGNCIIVFVEKKNNNNRKKNSTVATARQRRSQAYSWRGSAVPSAEEKKTEKLKKKK
jgi:glycerol-3-phosphate cytidylyltransferase-like family protein